MVRVWVYFQCVWSIIYKVHCIYIWGFSSFNFLDTKKEICPYTFKSMISLPLEISNELDEIKGRIHELLYKGFV